MSFPSLHLRHSSFSKLSISSPTSQLILQAFHLFTYVTANSPTLPLLCLHHSSFSKLFHLFTYVTANSPTLPSLHLCHSSFSNPSFASLLILQPLRHFTYVTTHSPTLPSLYLRHSSFTNLSVASPMSQFILQPFLRFSYVTSSSLNSSGNPPMILFL